MKNKLISSIIILLIYLLAFGLGMVLYYYLPISNLLLKLFVVDLVATLIVWLFGVIFNNSSVYDPYWSVLPMFFVPLYLLTIEGANIQTYIMVALIEIWGLRLTFNWLRSFKNLKTEDWRYQMYRTKHPKLWPIINLFGINLMPTVVVFLALMPILYFLELSTVINFNLSTLLGMTIVVVGIGLELVADQQMNKFKKTEKNPLAINKIGLWGKSRHPNYFGEILFWWGGYLMMLSLEASRFILLLGPLLVTLLFVFISIPMMEKRQLTSKRDYQEYLETTNMLLIGKNKELKK